MKKKSLKSLLLASLAIFVLGFFAYQIIQSFFIPLRTETALYTEEKEFIEAEGVFIRDEHLVSETSKDVLYYIVEDGGHVADGGVIAKRYKKESDVAAQHRIVQLDSEIGRLEKFSGMQERVAVNPEALQSKADESMVALLSATQSGAYTQAEEKREDMLYVLNEQLIMYEKIKDFSKRIASLREEKNKLESQSQGSTGELCSERAGYFISYADGYEGAFDFAQAASLTPESLSLTEKTAGQVGDDVIGKVVSSYGWYTGITVSETDARRIKEASSIKLSIPSAQDQDIPVTLEAINYNKDHSQAAVIFRCDYMNKALSGLRQSDVMVVLGTHRGLKIPQKAIHMRKCTARVLAEQTGEDEKQVYEEKEQEYEGVYVRIGDRMYWRFIERLFTQGDTVICALQPAGFDPQSTDFLDYYDEVIVEGRNLEHGSFIR